MRFDPLAVIKHFAVTAMICFIASIFLRANFWVVFLFVEVAFFSNLFVLGKGKKKNPFMKTVNHDDVIDLKKDS